MRRMRAREKFRSAAAGDILEFRTGAGTTAHTPRLTNANKTENGLLPTTVLSETPLSVHGAES